MKNLDPLLSSYAHLGFGPNALALVQAARENPPRRRVGGTRFRAVASHFPSPKMGCTIQAESRTGELPLVHRLELDDDVIEYYDQPFSVIVSAIRRGRRQPWTYTPDFLVLRAETIEVIEARPAKWIFENQVDHPDEWTEARGRLVCLPYAKPFQENGIEFFVHRNEDINSIEAANLVLLVAAKSKFSGASDKLLKRAHSYIRKHKVVTIHDLVEATGVESANVFAWTANQEMFVAIGQQLLSDTRTTRIFSDADARDNFSEILASHHLGELNTGECLALNDRQILLALERYKRVLPDPDCNRGTTRTDRRIAAAVKRCRATGENPLVACAPRFDLRGNRNSRLSQAQLAVMNEAITTRYATAASRSAKWVYRTIDWNGEPPVSYVTFLKLIKSRPTADNLGKRIGHRAWLASRPPSEPRLRSVAPSTAWELVHIDHTPIDEKVWGSLGLLEVLGRPWLTTMVDSWSNAVLAFWLCFSPPSWQTLAMLLRDCVRRHGRLPIAWISDQGPDFGGKYWEAFSAAYGCTKMDRPVADARSGSEVEQKFHALHQDLIYQLDGNMQNDRRLRGSTASHKSNATARFTLSTVHRYIDEYYFSHFNRVPHGTHTFTPEAMLMEAACEVGHLTRPVSYNFDFKVDTAWRPKSTSYKIDSRRGIRVNQTPYWAEQLGRPDLDGIVAEVRLEPFDSSLIYAFVHNRWIACTASDHVAMASLDDISRWVQTMIDTHGWSMARAVRRVADEKFAKAQSAQQEVDDPKRTTKSEATFEARRAATPRSLEFDEVRLLNLQPLDLAE